MAIACLVAFAVAWIYCFVFLATLSRPPFGADPRPAWMITLDPVASIGVVVVPVAAFAGAWIYGRRRSRLCRDADRAKKAALRAAAVSLFAWYAIPSAIFLLLTGTFFNSIGILLMTIVSRSLMWALLPLQFIGHIIQLF